MSFGKVFHAAVEWGVIQRMTYLAGFFGCSSLYAMMKPIRAMTRMPANTK